MSSHNRLEVSLLTVFLTVQRYQPVLFRFTSVTLIMLVFPCAKVVMLPLRVSCCHTYWIGPVPLSRLQRIHIVEPSTGDASLINRYGLLTGTVQHTCRPISEQEGQCQKNSGLQTERVPFLSAFLTFGCDSAVYANY